MSLAIVKLYRNATTKIQKFFPLFFTNVSFLRLIHYHCLGRRYNRYRCCALLSLNKIKEVDEKKKKMQ